MSQHLDNALDQEQVHQLQTHVAKCKSCRAEWVAMRSASSLLKAEPVVAPEADFAARVARRVQQHDVHRRRLRSSIRVFIGSMALWGAAAMMLTLLFAAFWQPLLGVLWMDVAMPLATNALSVVRVLGGVLYTVLYDLANRPAWLLMLCDALLALALVALWSHIVVRPHRSVLGLQAQTQQ
jgi:anti-sigma factor RsiW